MADRADTLYNHMPFDNKMRAIIASRLADLWRSRSISRARFAKGPDGGQRLIKNHESCCRIRMAAERLVLRRELFEPGLLRETTVTRHYQARWMSRMRRCRLPEVEARVAGRTK